MYVAEPATVLDPAVPGKVRNLQWLISELARRMSESGLVDAVGLIIVSAFAGLLISGIQYLRLKKASAKGEGIK